MACIIKKKKKGRWYYYAAESARVNGKPRIVWQKYLGTVDAIVKRAEQAAPPKPKETVIFEAGGVAGLLPNVWDLCNSLTKPRPRESKDPRWASTWSWLR